MTTRDIDPVTFEVIQNGLDSLVDEMAITIMRTAYSGIVKDALDYSTALCDRNGRVIAQGLTIIMHLGSFPSIVNSIIRQYEGRIYPGDVFIANDPYESGGIHLPDVFIIKPIYVNDELEAFAGTVAHQADIGGLVSGSNATEVRRDLPGRPADPNAQALRTRRSQRDTVRHDKNQRARA